MQSKSSPSVRIFYPAHNRTQLLDKLRIGLGALASELPLRRAVLFGSWAAGRATAASDVDLLVVHAGPPRDDAYRLVWKTLGIRGLEAHVYAEFDAMRLGTAIERMTRGGIDLL